MKTKKSLAVQCIFSQKNSALVSTKANTVGQGANIARKQTMYFLSLLYNIQKALYHVRQKMHHFTFAIALSERYLLCMTIFGTHILH